MNNRAELQDPTAPAGELLSSLHDEFMKSGVVRYFRKNTIVVQQGDPAEALYLVVEGELLVYVDDESGRVMELNRLGKGQYFGELLLGSAVRTASVRTLTAARLCVVRRADFERIIAEKPAAAFQLIQNLIEKVKTLTDNVRSLALMDVYGRVARMLLDNSKEVDGHHVVEGLTQQRIADAVGASRSMVNRILKDLAAGGYITIERGTMTIHRGLPKRW
jgi:CRP/FNR family cyclic AMP-dependent transcriptional regulator